MVPRKSLAVYRATHREESPSTVLNIAGVTSAVARGDLSRKITVDVKVVPRTNGRSFNDHRTILSST